jgi:hypothetical protein
VIVCGSWKRRCEWWKHWPNENTRCRFVLSMWKLQYTYIITLSYIAVYIQSACCCTCSSRVCVRAQLTASSLWPLSCGYHPCRSRMLFKISWPSSRDSRDHLPRNHIPKTHPSCHVGFNVYIYYIYIRIYQWDSMGSRWVGIHQPSWHVQRDAKRCKECQFLLHTFVFLAGLALFPMFDLRVWDYWRASGLWVGRPFKSSSCRWFSCLKLGWNSLPCVFSKFGQRPHVPPAFLRFWWFWSLGEVTKYTKCAPKRLPSPCPGWGLWPRRWELQLRVLRVSCCCENCRFCEHWDPSAPTS